MESKSPGASVSGVLVAALVFLLVWISAAVLLGALDSLRGQGDDKLQAIFREFIAPGVGGYAAMAAVGSWVPRADPRFVLLGFSAALLLFIGFYFGFLTPAASNGVITAGSLLLGGVSLVSGIVGAYLYFRGH
ncbi:hypothetical protein ACSHT0_08030 [Tepidicaulis sp. LMO-SS28]|uniref:hypothetical protein n=1 Tax=Tepidicaulis sp. LMO-SS28 TaxID=3447455 RepID=UPI003EE2E588